MQALKSMLSAIAGKNGLAPGVSLEKFKWFLQKGRNSDTLATPKSGTSKSGNPPLIVKSAASNASSTGMAPDDGAVEVESEPSVTSSAPVVVEESAASGSLTEATSAPDEEAQLGPAGMAALGIAVSQVRADHNVAACPSQVVPGLCFFSSNSGRYSG